MTGHLLTCCILNIAQFEVHTHPSVKMAAHRFIQYAVGSKKKPATVYLKCHVKPGASKVREGITSLTDDTIELCVSAIARDGESNKAVVAVLSEVRNRTLRSSRHAEMQRRRNGVVCVLMHIGQALDVTKSNIQITRGAKSRDKVIAVSGKAVEDGEAECLSRLLKRLGQAVEDNKGG